MTLASVVAAPVAGRLATRLGSRATAALALLLVAAGLLLMARLSESGGTAAVLAGTVVGVTGFMLFSYVPLTIAASGAREKAGGAWGRAS